MGRADPRNAIVAMLAVAVAAVFWQLIRGHETGSESNGMHAKPLPCTHQSSLPATARQAAAPMYDIGPNDESVSQGLMLDYSLKLLYCRTPKGGDPWMSEGCPKR